MAGNSAENRCIELLRKIRWSEGVGCPRCGGGRIIEVRKHLKTCPEYKRYYCYDCRYTFSDTSMTIFHGSRLPLCKWFDAIILWAKGSSAMDIKKELRVTYKAAWRIKHLLEHDPLAHKIRQRLVKEG